MHALTDDFPKCRRYFVLSNDFIVLKPKTIYFDNHLKRLCLSIETVSNTVQLNATCSICKRFSTDSLEIMHKPSNHFANRVLLANSPNAALSCRYTPYDIYSQYDYICCYFSFLLLAVDRRRCLCRNNVNSIILARFGGSREFYSLFIFNMLNDGVRAIIKRCNQLCDFGFISLVACGFMAWKIFNEMARMRFLESILSYTPTGYR